MPKQSGPPSKVIALGLEEVVMRVRAGADGHGGTLEQIVAACNQDLGRRGVEASVSKSTIKRYLGALAAATAPALHAPQVAAENARVAIEFGRRLASLDEKLARWLEEADVAVTPMRGVLWDPYLQAPIEKALAREAADLMRDRLADVFEYVDQATANELREWITPSNVMVPDWHARTSVARELRQLLEAYANIMERIHDAEEVKAFQESIVDAIREASPDVAARVLVILRERQSVRKAALLGLEN